ncbi:nucleotidyltransferase family protein [Silvibacterium acidisoli]|uniref:nucleotidyltransferase family protein n=1 Tax=Acidobacteriaceae bacterium ZG23-2 TaxID=2883246 RepID=UPI00406C2E09
MEATAIKRHEGRWGAPAAREAAVKLFCDPLPECCLRLEMLNASEWKKLLHWLDVSGLALYFLDRIHELEIPSVLPAVVLDRLQRNLHDNTRRMQDLLEEFAAIHFEFQRADLSYATVKGFALWPDSVARPELRSQLDLDFIVSPHSAMRAREILEARGYHLHAASGRSWEFKANQIAGMSLRDIYTPSPYRCVEIHIEDQGPGTRLERRERRQILGVEAFALTAGDQFVDQGMHLYKHITRDFFRMSHLLEFRRQVEKLKEDDAFWRQIESDALKMPDASVGLGVAILLTSRVQGSFAPESLTRWTVERVPLGARQWLERYGSRMACSDFPGTKLGMMLQKELSIATGNQRPVSRPLIPLRLPPPIVKAPTRESAVRRFRRRYFELRFILFRLRFHCVEGLRYRIESARWARYRDRTNRIATSRVLYSDSRMKSDSSN